MGWFVRGWVKVEKFIEKLNRHLKSEYDLTGLIKHKPTKGTSREDIVKNSIGELMPKFFFQGSGEIIDPSGKLSKQQDLILYSPYMSILKASKLNWYPVDSVSATIAIKSKIDRSKLKEDFENIKSVKEMKITLKPSLHLGSWRKKVQCNIFGFVGGSLENTKKNIGELKSKLKLSEDEMFDNLCVLDKFLITNNPLLKKHFNISSQYAYLKLKDKSFLYFLDSMLNDMNIPLAPTPLFAKYIGKFKVEYLK